MLGQDLPFLKKCIEWFHCEVYDYDFQKGTRSTQNNFVSIVITCKSIIGKTICVKKRNWSFEVEENNSNDTLVCDDDAHKVVLCAYSPFFLKSGSEV